MTVKIFWVVHATLPRGAKLLTDQDGSFVFLRIFRCNSQPFLAKALLMRHLQCASKDAVIAYLAQPTLLRPSHC